MNKAINTRDLNAHQLEIINLISSEIADKDFKAIKQLIQQYLNNQTKAKPLIEEEDLLKSIENISENSDAFAFLNEEEDLYSLDDLKEKF